VARPGPSSRGQLHVGRYFGALLLLFALLYAGVVFEGPGSHPLTPKLGLDLQGGAQVILTPKTTNGKKATSSQLSTAVDILRQRVNLNGVTESEVVIEGEQIVVSVPGGNRDSIASVTQAAELQMRQVLEAQPVIPIPRTTATPTASASPARSASVTVPKPTATTNKRPLTAGLLTAATPTAKPTPKPTPTPKATVSATPSATPSASPTASGSAVSVRSGDAYSPAAYAALDCSNPSERAGGAPNQPNTEIIACDRLGTEKYHLAVAKVVGKDVKGANVGTDSTGITISVNVQFKGSGQDKFTKLTQDVVSLPAPTNRVAIVLDGVSYSAPTIQSVINSDAQITGGFTSASAPPSSTSLTTRSRP